MGRKAIYASQAEKSKAAREREAARRAAEQEEKGLPPAPAIATMPSRARWDGLVQRALVMLETCRNEMEAYQEERSEAWQESERGEEFQERVDALQELCEQVSEFLKSE